MNGLKPVTVSLVLLVVKEVVLPSEVKVIVYWVIIPFRSWTKGRSQVRVTDVEDVGIVARFNGGPLGAVWKVTQLKC